MKKSQSGKPTAKQFDDAVQVSKATIDAFVKVGTEAASKGYEQAVELTREHVGKASTAFIKGYGDIQGLGKGNMDAVVEAGTVWAKGAEQIGKQVMALTQNSMQSSVVTAKALMGCKTLREVLDLQAGFARSNFDALVNEGTKLGELSMKVANETIAPIQARVSATVEKLTKAQA
jgi:phasin family protein